MGFDTFPDSRGGGIDRPLALLPDNFGLGGGGSPPLTLGQAMQAKIVRSYSFNNDGANNLDLSDAKGVEDLSVTAGDIGRWGAGPLGDDQAYFGAGGWMNVTVHDDMPFVPGGNTGSFAFAFWAGVRIINAGPIWSNSQAPSTNNSIRINSSGSHYIQLQLTNTIGSFDVTLGSGIYASPANSHWFVAQWNAATGLAELYRNGILVDSAVQAAIRTGPASIHMGIDPVGALGTWGGVTQNLLDEFWVAKDIFTPAEIAAGYNGGLGREYADLAPLV